MNTLEFAKDIPADKLAIIFKDFFEQHMVAYEITKNIIEFAGINSVSFDKASIIYSIRLLDGEDKEKILNSLKSATSSLVMYGREYKPKIFMNGDLLCIDISK